MSRAVADSPSRGHASHDAIDAGPLFRRIAFGAFVTLYLVGVGYLLFGASRAQPLTLLAAVAATLPGYWLLVRQASPRVQFALGLGLRLAALAAFPRLSEDIYRFLWDGALWWEGLHPLSTTPAALAQEAGVGAAFAKTYAGLFAAMNSPQYFTVYPPLAQAVFVVGGAAAKTPWLGAALLKVPLLLAELGVWRALRRLRPDRPRMAAAYWLHPAIVVELVGNAHFEGLALLGLLWALVALRNPGTSAAPARGLRVPTAAALALACGSLAKLVPLLAAPAISLHLLWRPRAPAGAAQRSTAWRWDRAATFAATLLIAFGSGFAAFVYGADLTGFGESLDLYFRRFEFNGSLYPVARATGIWYRGYNWIAVVGPALASAGAAGIVALAGWRAWRGRALSTTLLWGFGLYLLCATTVHPWYFAYVIALGALSGYRWPLVLGYTGFISYVAYVQTPVEVPAWATAAEYLPVVGLLLWELWSRRGRKVPHAAPLSMSS